MLGPGLTEPRVGAPPHSSASSERQTSPEKPSCAIQPPLVTPSEASRISVQVPQDTARSIPSPVPSALKVPVPLSDPFQITVPVSLTSLMALPPVHAAIDFDAKETA